MTMLGKHHSLETRKKISKANTGYNNGFFSQYNKTHIKRGSDSPSWKGGKERYPNCPICNKKLSFLKSKACIKHKKTNPKKDITQLKKSENKMNDSAYMNWSHLVRKRDYGKCKLLSSECRGRLESHHIFDWINYPELRYILTNGITLCAFHHPRGREEEKRMIPILQELLSVSKE